MSEPTDLSREDRLAEAGRSLHLAEKLLREIGETPVAGPDTLVMTLTLAACLVVMVLSAMMASEWPVAGLLGTAASFVLFWVFVDWRVASGIRRRRNDLRAGGERVIAGRRAAIAEELGIES